MKSVKKVFAILLAVVLAAGMGITATADETITGTITVKNAASNATYTAYKIFDVVYTSADNPTKYSYTISTGSEWLDTIIAYIGGYTEVEGKWYKTSDTTTNGGTTTVNEGATAATTFTSDSSGLTLTLSARGSEYVVTRNDEQFSAEDFAQALYAALEGYTVVNTSEVTVPDANITYYIHTKGQYEVCEDLTAFEDGTTYYTKGDGLEIEGTVLENSDGKAKADGLELGYYFVTTSIGSLADLTTTNPSATIYDKNEVPPFDKSQKDTEDENNYTDGALTVDVGDTVYYQITGKVPSTTGYETYTYKVSDTMSKGLTFNKDVTVKFGETEVTLTEVKDPDATLTDGQIRYSEKGFELYFDMTKHQDYVDKAITITYSAVVNSDAVTAVSVNTATLEYSNDPNEENSTGKTTDEVYIYSSKIVIDKYETGDEESKLSGAEFVLYKEVEEGETTEKKYYQAVYEYTYTDSSNETVTVYSADGKTYYSDPELKTEVTVHEGETPEQVKLAKVNWVDQSEATVVTTDKYGAAEFDGLEDGVYYLLEVEAPDGYNFLTAPVEVDVYLMTRLNSSGIEGGGAFVEYSPSQIAEKLKGNAAETYLTYDVGVANSTGTELPETGGIGTTIFYIVGSVLAIGAAVLLIVRRRMKGISD